MGPPSVNCILQFTSRQRELLVMITCSDDLLNRSAPPIVHLNSLQDRMRPFLGKVSVRHSFPHDPGGLGRDHQRGVPLEFLAQPLPQQFVGQISLGMTILQTRGETVSSSSYGKESFPLWQLSWLLTHWGAELAFLSLLLVGIVFYSNLAFLRDPMFQVSGPDGYIHPVGVIDESFEPHFLPFLTTLFSNIIEAAGDRDRTAFQLDGFGGSNVCWPFRLAALHSEGEALPTGTITGWSVLAIVKVQLVGFLRVLNLLGLFACIFGKVPGSLTQCGLLAVVSAFVRRFAPFWPLSRFVLRGLFRLPQCCRLLLDAGKGD